MFTKLFLGILSVLFGLTVIVAVALVFALPIMWLMNAVLAPTVMIFIVGTAKIGFWKALGLTTLCGLLFKSSK